MSPTDQPQQKQFSIHFDQLSYEKDEKPSNLPVQQPTTFNPIINLQIAAALGLDLKNSAPALFTIAYELIE